MSPDDIKALLSCKVCLDLCKRPIVMKCCSIRACRTCAFAKVKKTSKCWKCETEGYALLITDYELRDAMKAFRESSSVPAELLRKIQERCNTGTSKHSESQKNDTHHPKSAPSTAKNPPENHQNFASCADNSPNQMPRNTAISSYGKHGIETSPAFNSKKEVSGKFSSRGAPRQYDLSNKSSRAPEKAKDFDGARKFTKNDKHTDSNPVKSEIYDVSYSNYIAKQKQRNKSNVDKFRFNKPSGFSDTTVRPQNMEINGFLDLWSDVPGNNQVSATQPLSQQVNQWSNNFNDRWNNSPQKPQENTSSPFRGGQYLSNPPGQNFPGGSREHFNSSSMLGRQSGNSFQNSDFFAGDHPHEAPSPSHLSFSKPGAQMQDDQERINYEMNRGLKGLMMNLPQSTTCVQNKERNTSKHGDQLNPRTEALSQRMRYLEKLKELVNTEERAFKESIKSFKEMEQKQKEESETEKLRREVEELKKFKIMLEAKKLLEQEEKKGHKRKSELWQEEELIEQNSEKKKMRENDEVREEGLKTREVKVVPREDFGGRSNMYERTNINFDEQGGEDLVGDDVDMEIVSLQKKIEANKRMLSDFSGQQGPRKTTSESLPKKVSVNDKMDQSYINKQFNLEPPQTLNAESKGKRRRNRNKQNRMKKTLEKQFNMGSDNNDRKNRPWQTDNYDVRNNVEQFFNLKRFETNDFLPESVQKRQYMIECRPFRGAAPKFVTETELNSHSSESKNKKKKKWSK